MHTHTHTFHNPLAEKNTAKLWIISLPPGTYNLNSNIFNDAKSPTKPFSGHVYNIGHTTSANLICLSVQVLRLH